DRPGLDRVAGAGAGGRPLTRDHHARSADGQPAGGDGGGDGFAHGKPPADRMRALSNGLYEAPAAAGRAAVRLLTAPWPFPSTALLGRRPARSRLAFRPPGPSAGLLGVVAGVPALRTHPRQDHRVGGVLRGLQVLGTALGAEVALGHRA